MSHKVCLTFHFDAVSLWPGMFNMSSPAPVSRGEFGARIAVPRILEILKREGLQCTFFTPGLTIETYPELCKRIVDEGHEIAHHGYRHVSPVPMSEEEEREELLNGLDAMDRILGTRAVGYCSPASDLSPNSIKLLHENGFLYDATMSGTDFEPYWCRSGDQVTKDGKITFGKEVEVVSLPFAWSMDDFPQMELVLGNSILPGNEDPEKAERMWIADMDFMVERIENGVYVMCFHPQVIGRGARLRIVENMINRARELGAELTTCKAAAQDWKDRNPFQG